MSLKVAITAGAGGIGLVTAQAFRSIGAAVCVCDADAAAIDRLDAGSEIFGQVADVTREDEASRFVAAAVERMGGLDVLVNGAGIAGPTGLLEELDLAGWKRCLDVTLDGTFLVSRSAIPVLKAQRAGLIVNFSSTAGLFGFARRSPYAAAKWAIIGLTKTMAEELGPFGIRVNAMAPGSVEGDRMDRVIAAESAVTGKTPEQIRHRWTRTVSMRRFVTPQEIAGAIVFLTTPAGSAISGVTLPVDGNTEAMSLFD